MKKLKNKQRKKAKQEAMKKERQRQEEQQKQAQRPKSQDGDLDGPKEEELVPEKLAKVCETDNNSGCGQKFEMTMVLTRTGKTGGHFPVREFL